MQSISPFFKIRFSTLNQFGFRFYTVHNLIFDVLALKKNLKSRWKEKNPRIYISYQFHLKPIKTAEMEKVDWNILKHSLSRISLQSPFIVDFKKMIVETVKQSNLGESRKNKDEL